MRQPPIAQGPTPLRITTHTQFSELGYWMDTTKKLNKRGLVRFFYGYATLHSPVANNLLVWHAAFRLLFFFFSSLLGAAALDFTHDQNLQIGDDFG